MPFQDPFGEEPFIPVQGEEPVPGLFHHRGGTREYGFWVDQVGRIQGRPALFALVPVRLFIPAFWAGTGHEAVCEELARFGIVELLPLLFDKIALVVKCFKKFRSRFTVDFSRGTGVVVKRDAEFSKGTFNDPVILVDQLPGGDTLLLGLHGDGHPVFIAPADK